MVRRMSSNHYGTCFGLSGLDVRDMDDSAADMIKLVKASSDTEGLEGSGRGEVSEVRFWKRGQFALFVSHLGGEEGGLSVARA